MIHPLIKKVNMNRIIIAILSILFFLNMSCIQRDKATDSSDSETIELSDGLVWNDSYLSINQIAVSDSMIWIHSDQDDKAIVSVYSITGNLIAKGISYGKGHGEIMELTSIHPNKDNTITIYDSRGGKLQKINVSDNNILASVVNDSLYLYDDAVILQDSQIITLPLNSPYSYILSDLQGNHIDSLSYFPPKPKGMDDNTHHLACTGTLALSTNGQNMMRTTLYDGGVDFFRIENGKIKHINRFSLFDMDYDALKLQVKVPIPNEKSKTGYSFLYATDKYFYASYSESKATENPDGVCSEIHVFDTTGNLIKKILLDKTFTAFAVERHDGAMYIASDQGEKVIIYKYKIPELSS